MSTTTKQNNQSINKFDAEVGKVLDLVINNIYTNKDIFLRELISNAADACEKLRYLSLENPQLLKKDDYKYEIKVHLDIPNKSIIISDTGIGMDDVDMKNNLGIIASSGTQKFLHNIDDKNKNNLIGQFGIGFYSVFMISNDVEVISVKAGTDKAYTWKSNGKDGYTISDDVKDFDSGTEIKIVVKNEEFLNAFKIKQIIKDYSNHIAFPIIFSEINDKNEEVKPYQINDNQAIWYKNKKDITQENYDKFYQSLSGLGGGNAPYLTIHNMIEGNIEFINLLFVPSIKPYNLFHPDRKSKLKLYVKKIFITDENVDLIPKYLRFVEGIIDCNDLPLNISRETLQYNPVINKIKINITKKIISELQIKQKKDKESYENFWNNFGAVIKEGLCEQENIIPHKQLLDLCLFFSVLENKMITLKEYIEKLNTNQKTIYYFIGDNIDEMKKSPYIENFINTKTDVLLLTEHVDDFWVNIINKYDDLSLQSATRSNDIDNKQDKSKDNKKDDSQDKICKYFKEILKDRVSDVIISDKLTTSSVCLTAPSAAGFDIRMERALSEQNQIKNQSKKILEINIKHSIIKHIANNLTNDSNKDLVEILFGQATLISGAKLSNCHDYNDAVNNTLLNLI